MIRSSKDAILLNEALDDFEDGIVKEVWLNGPDWLDEDDRIIFGKGASVIVLVQLQSSKSRSCRLHFSGVSSVEFYSDRETVPCKFTSSDGEMFTMEFLSCRIVAEVCEAEVRGGLDVGQGPLLASDDIVTDLSQ